MVLGEKQEHDIKAMALWGGNRSEHGRITGRQYPRASYPKVVWVHPADVQAAPQLWQRVPEAPPPVEEKDGKLYGIEALEAALIEQGIVKKPVPTPLPRAPMVQYPNVARVRRLGLKAKGIKEPVFLMPREEFPSYSDFWKLVRLSGFEIQYIDQARLDDPDTICIFVTPTGIPDCSKARARTIFWQLEYVGEYTDQENRETVKEVWASDGKWAEEHGAKYVLLGSHPGLGGEPVRPQYDVVMLAYMTHRREQLRTQLSELRWPPIYPGHEGERRHEILRSSRLMLHAHQYDEGAETPLRYALAAAYHLPFIGETIPGMRHSSQSLLDIVPYENLAETVFFALQDPQGLRAVGEKLYTYLCVEHSFEMCVREAL